MSPDPKLRALSAFLLIPEDNILPQGDNIYRAHEAYWFVFGDHFPEVKFDSIAQVWGGYRMVLLGTLRVF